jgi:hypothetical protein
MLRRPFKSAGYHTTIKSADFVHPTRDSLTYALALLDSELEEYKQRAFEIIDKLVSLQDSEPSSPTFGIWSWFYEEPLAQMSPPDWNWADFCGKRLLLAMVRHGARFPAPLYERTKRAVYISCDAIIKRNVGPEYTSIAIMGAFVTLIAGECFGEERYAAYGLDRLEKFYRHTKACGTFTEYNSPTYTVVAIEELSSILTETDNLDAKRMVSELLDLAWEMVAFHFHPVLKQWSGPHARSYATMLSPETLSFLQMACGGKVKFLEEEAFDYSVEWYRNRIECPEKYDSYFTEIGVREREQTIVKAVTAKKWATMYADAKFALGTFHSNIMWNQCRNLLAYMANGALCTYLHLRVLHDGYDYSSAVFNSVQHIGDVLFGIGFATDGGGTHPNLDMVNGKITASDLRIRFELGGCQDSITIDQQEGDIFIDISGMRLTIRTLYGTLDQASDFPWAISREEDKACVDLVLYSGQPREFDFHEIGCACFVFAFAVSDGDAGLNAGASLQGDRVRGEFMARGGTRLELNVPVKPDSLSTLMDR